jgi:hypothetical protein
LALLSAVGATPATDQADQMIAVHLAAMLKAARTVVSQNQGRINDPNRGDKGLTGDKVLADADAIYRKQVGADPLISDPATLEGRLLRAQQEAIKTVIDKSQDTINAKGVGFKGLIPAVFARLVNEEFARRVGDVAKVKVTAPERLIRNRKARPDPWENTVMAQKFASADWPKGNAFSEVSPVDGRSAYRFLVPEYYAASCLACHGEPAGEVDITGYPKEGGHEGDLGSAISITLFK